MLAFIKKIFGIEEAPDFNELLQEGAVILDVRTKAEFNQGHIKNALNIPVDQLGSNLSKLKDKEAPIITCCASGMRSASAKHFLRSKGYKKVYNGGGWYSLQKKLAQ